MFRKGGPAMEGVMNGIEDRTNFNTGDLVKKAQERKKLLERKIEEEQIKSYKEKKINGL